MRKMVMSALAAVAVYLLGAFANAGFDITAWSDLARVLVAGFIGAAVFITLGALSGT